LSSGRRRIRLELRDRVLHRLQGWLNSEDLLSHHLDVKEVKDMKKTIKPYFTAANAKMKGKPEKYGLPSNKTINNSVYAKCGKKK
jgi:hypothetical protein